MKKFFNMIAISLWLCFLFADLQSYVFAEEYTSEKNNLQHDKIQEKLLVLQKDFSELSADAKNIVFSELLALLFYPEQGHCKSKTNEGKRLSPEEVKLYEKDSNKILSQHCEDNIRPLEMQGMSVGKNNENTGKKNGSEEISYYRNAYLQGYFYNLGKLDFSQWDKYIHVFPKKTHDHSALRYGLSGSITYATLSQQELQLIDSICKDNINCFNGYIDGKSQIVSLIDGATNQVDDLVRHDSKGLKQEHLKSTGISTNDIRSKAPAYESLMFMQKILNYKMKKDRDIMERRLEVVP